MATKTPTLIERLNKLADEVEIKAKIPKSKNGNTVTEALDRLEEAVKKLP
jgi:hypothetical protein